ncbi:hypothetical protein Hanom_Chr09g00773391 [Helianthus anomalus]
MQLHSQAATEIINVTASCLQVQNAPVGILYEDETWRTSLESFHPAWLLVYRLVAFGVMLALLIANLIVYGANSLFFYT